MNTYKKFAPNVYVAACQSEHAKSDIIIVTTQYGKENECQVHNYLGKTKDGLHLYSITRTDGFDSRQRAMNKAEKLQQYSANAMQRSDKYYEASNEGKDFLVLAEPIKVGHHSEKRHRALIERNWNRMGKSVAEREKAETLADKAAYWESKANDINLSMPESVEYYAYKLEQAKDRHEGLKSGRYESEHLYSLTYATKAVKETTQLLELAKKLWA
jgi:hypothetical protein